MDPFFLKARKREVPITNEQKQFCSGKLFMKVGADIDLELMASVGC